MTIGSKLQATLLDEYHIGLPTTEYGDPYAKLSIIGVHKTKGYHSEGPLKIVGGHLNDKGQKTFYVLFTKDDADFKVKVENESHRRVRLEYETHLEKDCFVYRPRHMWIMESLEGSNCAKGWQRKLHFTSQTQLQSLTYTTQYMMENKMSLEDASKAVSRINIKFDREKGVYPKVSNREKGNFKVKGKMIQVFVKIPGELKPIMVDIGVENTTDELKQLIPVDGVSLRNLQMVLNGKQLRNGITLADMNVHPESTIELMGRIPGGRAPVPNGGLVINKPQVNDDTMQLGTRGAILAKEPANMKTIPTTFDVDPDFVVEPFTLELCMDPKYEKVTVTNMRKELNEMKGESEASNFIKSLTAGPIKPATGSEPKLVKDESSLPKITGDENGGKNPRIKVKPQVSDKLLQKMGFLEGKGLFSQPPSDGKPRIIKLNGEVAE